jgi:ABC-type glycerol-3-phosphate transport system substrate-binding protein
VAEIVPAKMDRWTLRDLFTLFPDSLWRGARIGFHLVLLGLLCGCVPRDESGRTLLTFSVWGSVRQTAVDEEIVAAFEATHPDVRVKLIAISKGYQEKIQAMMVGATAPDVLMLDNMVYGDWAERGALLEITDLIESMHAQDPFMPVALNTFDLRGSYYAMPVNCGTMVMFCNLDALAEVEVALPDRPLTWREFEALGPVLARSAGNPDAPTDYLWVAPPATALILAFGVDVFDDPHNPKEVTLEPIDIQIRATEGKRRGRGNPCNGNHCDHSGLLSVCVA